MSVEGSLSDLLHATRMARRLRDELSKAPRAEVLAAVAKAMKDARTKSDTEEQKVSLGCLATLLGEFDGDETVDLLIDLLDSEHAEVRVVAGEELEALAFDRFKEVAVGIERALARLPENGPALAELPYLLAEVAEPGCVKLIGKFLARKEPEIVASAIEALVELGEAEAAPLLVKLERDSRRVDLDDSPDATVTIGELATEARELLEEMSGLDEPRATKGGR